MATEPFASNLLTKDQAAKSFSGMIARFMPMGDAPIFAMTSMLRTELLCNSSMAISVRACLPSVVLSAIALIGDTILNVTSTANIIPGMCCVLMVPQLK